MEDFSNGIMSLFDRGIISLSEAKQLINSFLEHNYGFGLAYSEPKEEVEKAYHKGYYEGIISRGGFGKKLPSKLTKKSKSK